MNEIPKLLAVALAAAVFCVDVSKAQIGYQPPNEIHMFESEGRGVTFEDDGVPDGLHVGFYVEASTVGRRIFVHWGARSSLGSTEVHKVQVETLSFYPTAIAISRYPSNELLIAGRSLTGLSPVVERWDLSNYGLSEVFDISGQPHTSFTVPTITKLPVPCEISVGEISSITSNKRITGLGTIEHVVVFDYSNKQLVSLDPSSGAKTVMVDSNVAGPYLNASMREHSIYSDVCILSATPRGDLDLEATLPSLYAVSYDLTGNFLGDSTIPSDETFDDHVLFSTGVWLDGTPLF